MNHMAAPQEVSHWGPLKSLYQNNNNNKIPTVEQTVFFILLQHRTWLTGY